MPDTVRKLDGVDGVRVDQSIDGVRVDQDQPDTVRIDHVSTNAATRHETMTALDTETRTLIRVAALLAGGDESQVRLVLQSAIGSVNPVWIEEIILQTYLFAGFPRSLNGMREWRRISRRPAPLVDREECADSTTWKRDGEATCETVYGRFYKQLRHNIRDLHPALDAWMITDGYGKVLSRPQLDLMRRELCIVAACAVSRQDRQLHSHLHGALHAGATTLLVDETFETIDDLLPQNDRVRNLALWARVKGK